MLMASCDTRKKLNAQTIISIQNNPFIKKKTHPLSIKYFETSKLYTCMGDFVLICLLKCTNNNIGNVFDTIAFSS